MGECTKKEWDEKVKKQNKEMYSPEMIDYKLDIARDWIPQQARLTLAKALSLLPEKVIDFICENCVFMSNEDYGGGRWISFKNLFFKDRKGIIELDYSLWEKKSIEITYTIAHEVAHAFKDHHFSNYEDMTLEFDENQEKEADKLAIKWLSKHFSKDKLLKTITYLEREGKEVSHGNL